MRVTKIAAFAASLMISAASAQASVLADAITFDGNPDFLADDSLGVFIDTDGDNIADVVQGIVNLTSSTLTNPDTIPNVTGGNLYAAYSIGISLDVASSLINPAGPASVLQFDATGAPGAGLGVTDLLASLNIPVNNLAVNVENPGDALVAVFADRGGPTQNLSVFENLAPFNSAIDLEYNGLASEFDILLTAGFSESTDFYSLINTVIGPLGSPSSFSGSFNGVLSILTHSFAPGVQFVDVLDETGVAGDLVIEAEAGPGSGTFSSSDAQGFTFGDNASFVFNAVPEPTMLGVFGMLSALGYLKASRIR